MKSFAICGDRSVCSSDRTLRELREQEWLHSWSMNAASTWKELDSKVMFFTVRSMQHLPIVVPLLILLWDLLILKHDWVCMIVTTDYQYAASRIFRIKSKGNVALCEKAVLSKGKTIQVYCGVDRKSSSDLSWSCFVSRISFRVNYSLWADDENPSMIFSLFELHLKCWITASSPSFPMLFLVRLDVG